MVCFKIKSILQFISNQGPLNLTTEVLVKAGYDHIKPYLYSTILIPHDYKIIAAINNATCF